MAIEVEVAKQFRDRVSISRLHRAAAAVLVSEEAEGGVTVVVTDDETVAHLNRRFLGAEGPTDVLSFPSGGEDDQGFVLPPQSEPYLGDVIIALPYAHEQARRQGHDLADELDLLVVHGVLHLLGYDHANAEEKAEMWAKQEAILAQLGAS
ncbi:MAG: rRNA maturation RNase YbeY [Caldilineae bacterium]|nr:MAG: rRNA maturation RNase YbeY [Caldilineae bacterium]